MTTRTEYKLVEAEFFLAHLEEHWRHVPHVDFYLSACISAARSVTWVMKAEFGHTPGWKEWYEAKKSSSEHRELLKQINNARVRLTKTHPVKTRTRANVHVRPEDMTPEFESYLKSGAQGEMRLEPVDESNTIFNLMVGGRPLARAHLTKAEHEMQEFRGRDAKDVCREYVSELKELVGECLDRFNG
ncbi:hypothetical protein [Marinobacter sp.]|uniref:hypothetical protein n=1 Tax=Marinobacter sp. TaxID=50741 RepID=UPI003BACBAF7